MKLELFDSTLPATEQSVMSVLEDAKSFFSRYVPVKIVQEGELSWDIVSLGHGIELGSYGVRRYREHRWIYGTGVAIPRSDQVLAKERSSPLA